MHLSVFRDLWKLIFNKETDLRKKRILYSCDVRIEKSVPWDYSLSSLGKPRDAKRRSSGQIFLSYPQTIDGFLYSCTPGWSFYWFYPCERNFPYPNQPMEKVKIVHLHAIMLCRISTYKGTSGRFS